MHIVDELQARGLIFQSTDIDALKKHIDEGNASVYCGFDPTADSLHIGHLVPFLTLKRLQNASVRPITLVGGATGMIGDPKDTVERPMNTIETVNSYTESLKQQYAQLLDYKNHKYPAKVVNNFDWISKIDILTFLRDVGKHFSVNMMIKRDTIKNRLDRADGGISFTEFSYTLLQGLDFLHLAKTENCKIQIGGQDQWGNLLSGVDLCRKSAQISAHAISLPLLTTADGKKFGKSEGNAVWLDKNKLSAFGFYQFWINQPDSEIEKLMKVFSFMTLDEIKEAVEKHNEKPELRLGQKTLAKNMTVLLHGDEALAEAEKITAALFNEDLNNLTQAELSSLFNGGMESKIYDEDLPLVDVLVDLKLATSKTNARDFIKNGAIVINGEKILDEKTALSNKTGLFNNIFVIRRGKKNYGIVKIA